MLKTDLDKKQLNLASLDRTILNKEDGLERMKNIQKRYQNEQAGKYNKIQELTKALEMVRSKI